MPLPATKRRYTQLALPIAYLSSILLATLIGYSTGKHAPCQKAAAAGHLDSAPLPFYIPPAASHLRSLALTRDPVTDKVGSTSVPAAPNRQHTYDALYSKYFETNNQRLRRLKVLEIGLGCDMHYGPGASAWLWRAYMPNAEIWFAEYDTKCLQQYAANLTALNVRAVSGDQADNATLARWLAETGGNFDVIIDDGGHANHQIFNSFATLFHKALKPGGVYFIEDLQVSRTPEYRGTPGSPVMASVLTDWLESLMAAPAFAHLRDLQNRSAMQPAAAGYNMWKAKMQQLRDGAAYLPAYRLPTGVKTMECAAEMCAVVKCTADDPFCPAGMAKQPFNT